MSSPRSQRPQRLRQHASLSGRTDSSAESLAILQINVEGLLTIAKLDVLEQIAIKNKATVVLLQETHKENNAALKLPGFTLAGRTKSKHHGLATFIQDGVPWTPAGQCSDAAEVECIATKVRETTVVNVYKLSQSRLEQASLLDAPVPTCTPATSTVGTPTGFTRPPTKMASPWQNGHPPPMQCSCSTQRYPTRSSQGAGTSRPTQIWPLPKPSGKSHSRYDASWTGSFAPNIARH